MRASGWTAFALGALLAGGLALWGIAEAVRSQEVGFGEVDLDIGLELSAKLAALGERPREGRSILFLGDSLVMNTRAPDQTVPARLADRLRPRDVRVSPLVASALGAFSHYALSAPAIAARPDVVVLSVNLHWFGSAWPQLERADLVGWLPAERWPRALRLPLHLYGVSLDRALFTRLLVTSGLADDWRNLRRFQLRVLRGRRSLERWLDRQLGQARSPHYRERARRIRNARLISGAHVTAEGARYTLGPVLEGLRADHPTLRLLDGLLVAFQQAGIPVLLYVAPLNVEHLRALGLYDAERFERSIRRIAELAGRRGATFLDLHDLLPDAAFSDYMSHLRAQGSDDPAGAVARRVAISLRGLLAARETR